MAIGNTLLNLLGKSPIRPIQQHMTVATACAEQLQGFLSAALENDWAKASNIYQSIRKFENEADDLKRTLRNQLPKGLFMPMDRRDLLHLLSTQDRIANRSKDISGLMLGRKMSIPETLQGMMTDFVSSAVATTRQAQKAIDELDELLETGFTGGEVTFVEGLISTLDDLEDDTDRLELDIRHTLFDLEKDLPPVDVMFLYQIIDMIGEVSDLAEDVGDRLQQILAR